MSFSKIVKFDNILKNILGDKIENIKYFYHTGKKIIEIQHKKNKDKYLFINFNDFNKYIKNKESLKEKLINEGIIND